MDDVWTALRIHYNRPRGSRKDERALTHNVLTKFLLNYEDRIENMLCSHEMKLDIYSNKCVMTFNNPINADYVRVEVENDGVLIDVRPHVKYTHVVNWQKTVHMSETYGSYTRQYSIAEMWNKAFIF